MSWPTAFFMGLLLSCKKIRRELRSCRTLISSIEGLYMQREHDPLTATVAFAYPRIRVKYLCQLPSM